MITSDGVIRISNVQTTLDLKFDGRRPRNRSEKFLRYIYILRSMYVYSKRYIYVKRYVDVDYVLQAVSFLPSIKITTSLDTRCAWWGRGIGCWSPTEQPNEEDARGKQVTRLHGSSIYINMLLYINGTFQKSAANTREAQEEEHTGHHVLAFATNLLYRTSYIQQVVVVCGIRHLSKLLICLLLSPPAAGLGGQNTLAMHKCLSRAHLSVVSNPVLLYVCPPLPTRDTLPLAAQG